MTPPFGLFPAYDEVPEKGQLFNKDKTPTTVILRVAPVVNISILQTDLLQYVVIKVEYDSSAMPGRLWYKQHYVS